MGEADSGRQARAGGGPPGMERSASGESASWQPLGQSPGTAPDLDAPPQARPSADSATPTRGEGELRRKALSSGQLSAARRMRRELTPAERKLWHALRAHRFQDLHIRRQVPMGRYIADFACHANRVVIEVDGEQHGFDQPASRDRARDAWFTSQGYQVLRFWNGQVLYEMESVLDTIYARVFQNAQPDRSSAAAPSPPLWGRADSGDSPSGEGGGSETLSDDGARLTLALDARQAPSSLGLRPSRASPPRGEGACGA
ncbi:MAG: endonuclease domain-containing protein [Microvirga sp.]